MNTQMKRSAENANDSDVSKRAKLEHDQRILQLNSEKSMTDKFNGYIELKMDKVPGTPLFTKVTETGRRVVLFEADFLTIIISKGNKRKRNDFTKINMDEFNKAIREAAVVMIPVTYNYKHYLDPTQPSKLKHHQDHMGMIIYWTETQKFNYIDVRLNADTRRVDKDVRVKKVYSIAMRFIRRKLKLVGKYRSQKLAGRNPMPNEPYVPLLWIVEKILANPNAPVPDPSQATDIDEYKEAVTKALKDKDNDSSKNLLNADNNMPMLNQ